MQGVFLRDVEKTDADGAEGLGLGAGALDKNKEGVTS